MQTPKKLCGNECMDFEGMYAGIECTRVKGHKGRHAMRYEWDDGLGRAEILIKYARAGSLARARTALASGEEAVVAFLTGTSVEDVRRVGGIKRKPAKSQHKDA